jgi:uncharacterized membrane protein YfcA
MHIYLPIADLTVNVLALLGIGTSVGFLSGMFGVGGGFLITPLLIFLGIQPGIAVATGANQIVGSSIAGLIPHWRRGNVDLKMGTVLLAGGVLGSGFGVWLFSFLRSLGQIDLVITLSYIIFLGLVGTLMLVESLRAMRRQARKSSGTGGMKRRRRRSWMQALPLKTRFRKSHLYISALVPFVVGIIVGILSAIMGVGGGFIMVPAMIYLIGMPTSVVVGTSLFQIIFVTADITVLQATTNQTVDVVLAVMLLLGGTAGAQFGARVGSALKGEQLRGLLAILVLGVCIKLAVDVTTPPQDLYALDYQRYHE